MDNVKHTPEPWDACFDGRRFIATAKDFTIVEAMPFAKNEYGEDCDKANIRRIVACVNACAGIDTETLEELNLASLVNAALE